MTFVTEDNITEIAANRWETGQTARLAKVMPSLVRHLHAFAREVDLTPKEWELAVDWLTAVGHKSTEKRQEFVLASDVLGLSMLVVQMASRFEPHATPATVLGPFHVLDSPPLPYGADMSEGLAGIPLYLHGRVLDTDGHPIPGVILDVWQADADGKYEGQMGEVDEARLRAKFQSQEDGSYCIRSIVPTGYSIPMDGPVGHLIAQTEISHFRPSHIHFKFDHPGYEPLITHIFEKDAPHLENDVVYGVKAQLVAHFRHCKPDELTPAGVECPTAYRAVSFDFVLQPVR